MCLSCGCGKPEDKHGDERNIILSEVIAAGQAAGISPQQAAENINQALRDIGEQVNLETGAE
jgi:hypothetical protein